MALLATLITLGADHSATALEVIDVAGDEPKSEITFRTDFYDRRGDQLDVDIVAGEDGLSGRMSVRSSTEGTNPSWAVFALRNSGKQPVERWLVADRYQYVGSGLLRPDLDTGRLVATTPSIGFMPERIRSTQADIFRLTVEPGQTVTYVVELASERYPRLFLWNATAYQEKQRDRMLFNGILIGTATILALFLTAIFMANHKAIFPTAAVVAWSVLAYLCIDLGFWHKLFQVTAADNAFWRAGAEASIAASLVVFLSTFLRIGVWHAWIRAFFGLWVMAQLAIVAAASLDPGLASTLGRVSFVAIALLGSIVILFLGLRGQDRALALAPTWLLLLVWVFGSGVAALGRLEGEMVVPALQGGLVMIAVLIGFTVTQFAFRTVEPIYGAAPNELQLRSLAIEGASSGVWEWNSRRDEISASPNIEQQLGLAAGELRARVDDWLSLVHQNDRDRMRILLQSLQEKGEGRIAIDFRLRNADNTYFWYELEAASVPEIDGRARRFVGLMRDVTEQKRSHERLVHDAVHDGLTSLPNRELFMDRVAFAISRARNDERPTVLLIDIDRFKNVNAAFGLTVGDSLLLAIARRLSRHLSPHDTLARIGGNQFAALILGQQDPRETAMQAERIRRALRSPMKIAGQDIILTGSIGIAMYDGQPDGHAQLFREAENAMYRAKRAGSDRIELFKPSMRDETNERLALESDLRRAIDRKQFQIVYQPIIRLGSQELAGFEALVRWEHPRLGLIQPSEFIPMAEEIDFIVPLGTHVLDRAAKEAARWHKVLPRDQDALFVSVNVSSRQLFRQDFIQEIRSLLRREIVPRGCLKLEVTESLVMENPERATEILGWLKDAGASLAMDDFGTGYSSLSYLQRFPFDTIKLDRALVNGQAEDEATRVVLRSTVAMAHELGRQVVAEGVEDAEDAAYLRVIGCELAQGFHFGEPMNERQVLDLLRDVAKAERGLVRSALFRFGRKKTTEDFESDAPAATANARPKPLELGAPQPAAATRSNDGNPPASAPTVNPTNPGSTPGQAAEHARAALSTSVPPRGVAASPNEAGGIPPTAPQPPRAAHAAPDAGAPLDLGAPSARGPRPSESQPTDPRVSDRSINGPGDAGQTLKSQTLNGGASHAQSGDAASGNPSHSTPVGGSRQDPRSAGDPQPWPPRQETATPLSTSAPTGASSNGQTPSGQHPRAYGAPAQPGASTRPNLPIPPTQPQPVRFPSEGPRPAAAPPSPYRPPLGSPSQTAAETRAPDSRTTAPRGPENINAPAAVVRAPHDGKVTETPAKPVATSDPPPGE